ncbi:MAG TPA: hypothetical protein VFV43_11965 [Limnobacter sp.]|nr:hypothetical protein [Limnobacter sp.]
MSRWRKWRRRLLIAAVLYLPFKLLWDIHRIPDFTNAYVSYSKSPDGKYLGMEMFGANVYPTPLSDRLMILGFKEPGVMIGLADASTGEVIAYKSLGKDADWMWGGSWICNKETRSDCRWFLVGAFVGNNLDDDVCNNVFDHAVDWLTQVARGVPLSEIPGCHNFPIILTPPNPWQRTVAHLAHEWRGIGRPTYRSVKERPTVLGRDLYQPN